MISLSQYGAELGGGYYSGYDYATGSNNIGMSFDPATFRPVVTLKSGITVTKDTTNDGSTLAKACTISE